MIQLRIIAGPVAGTLFTAKTLPVTLGRGSSNDFRLEFDGVWDKHLTIQLDSDNNFHLVSHPQALTVVRGERVLETRLRNGDAIDAGGVKLIFGLAAVKQRPLAVREGFAWFIVLVLAVVQVVAAAALFMSAGPGLR